MESQVLPREVLNIIGYQYFSVMIDVDHDKYNSFLIIKFPQVDITYNMFFPDIDENSGLCEEGKCKLLELENFTEKIKNIKDNSYDRIVYISDYEYCSFSIRVLNNIEIQSECYVDGEFFTEPRLSLNISLLPQLITALGKYVAMLQKFKNPDDISLLDGDI